MTIATGWPSALKQKLAIKPTYASNSPESTKSIISPLNWIQDFYLTFKLNEKKLNVLTRRNKPSLSKNDSDQKDF